MQHLRDGGLWSRWFLWSSVRSAERLIVRFRLDMLGIHFCLASFPLLKKLIQRHQNRIKMNQAMEVHWQGHITSNDCVFVSMPLGHTAACCVAECSPTYFSGHFCLSSKLRTVANGDALHKWLLSIFPSGYVRSSFAPSSWWYKGAIRPLWAAGGICWATWRWSNSGSNKVLRRNDSGGDQATWRKTDREMICNCVSVQPTSFFYVWRNVCKTKGPGYYLTSQQSSSSNTPVWHQDPARGICEVGQSKWRSSQSQDCYWRLGEFRIF